MSPKDIKKAEEIFSVVGKTAAFDMRKRCIEAIRRAKARNNSKVTEKYFTMLEKEIESFQIE